MRILIATDHFPPFIGGAQGEGFDVHRVRQLRTAFRFLVRAPSRRHP